LSPSIAASLHPQILHLIADVVLDAAIASFSLYPMKTSSKW
jgi:hypothetical protein